MLELTKRFPKMRTFTTGAGSGLGRELSLILAADGWNLGIGDINERSLMETAQLITGSGGQSIP